MSDDAVVLQWQVAEALGVPERVTRDQLARAVAEMANLRQPERRESAELLVALVVSVATTAMGWEGRPYYVGFLDALDIPAFDRETHLIDQVIAAADLGILDKPFTAEAVSPLDPSDASRETGDGLKLIEMIMFQWDTAMGDVADIVVDRLASRGLLS